MKIKRFEFNMFPVNCYVLWDDTHEAVLIDPGCYYEEEKTALKDYITSNELVVKHLLNTHLHIDHICGNPFCEKTFGIKSEAHEADLFNMLRQGTLSPMIENLGIRPVAVKINSVSTESMMRLFMEAQQKAQAQQAGTGPWSCPNCGAQNKGRFCEYCGSPKP